MDLETLKKDYETQRAGGKSILNLEAALAAAAASEEIDVVGGIDDSFDVDTDAETENEAEPQTRLKYQEMAEIKKKISPFSIESLLAKRQQFVQAAQAAQAQAGQIKTEVSEENNNPKMSSPIPCTTSSCSSPVSNGSMTSPCRNLSPSPSPSHATSHHVGPLATSGGLHIPIPIYNNHPNLSNEMSLLKPLTAGNLPEKSTPVSFSSAFLSKFDPSKISFSSTLASLKPEPPLTSSAPSVATNHEDQNESSSSCT